MKFHQILKQQRELRGWSQVRLAQELGTTANSISGWERQLSLPSPYFRERLCSVFDMSVKELGLLENVEEERSEQQNPVEQETVLVGKKVLQEEPARSEFPGEAYAQNTSFIASEYENSKPVQSASVLKQRQMGKRLWLVVSVLVSLALVAGGFVLAQPFAQANPYAGRGKLILDDTLRGQSQNLNWQEGMNENHASCQFREGGYYSEQPLDGYFHACLAQATNFHNFTYEVQVSLLQGEYAGIIFRAVNSIDSHYYLFRITSDGTYALKRYVTKADDDAFVLQTGATRDFHKGQKNILAVTAEENQLTLYVNHNAVATANDAAYSSGQIGVLAGNDNKPPALAVFSNVRVWAW